jgi:hypothetical protein
MMIVKFNMGLILLLLSYSLIHGHKDILCNAQIILMTITAINYFYVIKTAFTVKCHSYQGNSYGYSAMI